jgi:hypothetical protein
VGHERIIRYCLLEARHQAELGLAPFHRYVCEDGTVWTEFYRTDTGYILRFPDLADFGISADGTDVIAHPAEGEDAATVEHLYINQIVPLALSRQGRPTFHASVVTVPGGAVAFLGKTGMGKSTLAASFALNDAAFLTDDALLIEETDKSCRALPSHASLRLWDDSVKELVGPHSTLAAEISYSSKARLLAGKALAYRDEPQCLLAAFLLERQRVTKVSIRSLAGSESHMAWLRNSFLLDIEDRELLAQHFDWTLRIADTVPTFALDYPRDYGMLPEVRKSVRKYVSGLLNCNES